MEGHYQIQGHILSLHRFIHDVGVFPSQPFEGSSTYIQSIQYFYTLISLCTVAMKKQAAIDNYAKDGGSCSTQCIIGMMLLSDP